MKNRFFVVLPKEGPPTAVEGESELQKFGAAGYTATNLIVQVEGELVSGRFLYGRDPSARDAQEVVWLIGNTLTE